MARLMTRLEAIKSRLTGYKLSASGCIYTAGENPDPILDDIELLLEVVDSVGDCIYKTRHLSKISLVGDIHKALSKLNEEV